MAASRTAARTATIRTTRMIALAFAVLALLAALLSFYFIVSRPWGCSMSNNSTVEVCDWATSRLVAAAWLLVVIGISVIAWKRWAVALAVISLPLIAFSLVSFVGIFTLAPAAFWLGCALWLWSGDRRVWIVVSALVSVAVILMGILGVAGLFYLAWTPY